MSRASPTVVVGIFALLLLGCNAARLNVVDRSPEDYRDCGPAIHDAKTGLVWQRVLNPIDEYDGAEFRCAHLNVLGLSWRLASAAELRSINKDFPSPNRAENVWADGRVLVPFPWTTASPIHSNCGMFAFLCVSDGVLSAESCAAEAARIQEQERAARAAMEHERNERLELEKRRESEALNYAADVQRRKEERERSEQLLRVDAKAAATRLQHLLPEERKALEEAWQVANFAFCADDGISRGEGQILAKAADVGVFAVEVAFTCLVQDAYSGDMRPYGSEQTIYYVYPDGRPLFAANDVTRQAQKDVATRAKELREAARRQAELQQRQEVRERRLGNPHIQALNTQLVERARALLPRVAMLADSAAECFNQRVALSRVSGRSLGVDLLTELGRKKVHIEGLRGVLYELAHEMRPPTAEPEKVIGEIENEVAAAEAEHDQICSN